MPREGTQQFQTDSEDLDHLAMVFASATKDDVIHRTAITRAKIDFG